MNIKVGISNRHVHLNEEDYKTLFGGLILTKRNDLSQPHQYACNETVTIKTPKSSIEKVRILGPFRDYTQVEISKTDSYKLGINPPVRDSGNLAGAALITIEGPNGTVEKECAIIPTRHIHINEKDRIKYNLKNIDKVEIRVSGEKGSILENVNIKEGDFVPELHLDTDDANACLLKEQSEVEIILH